MNESMTTKDSRNAHVKSGVSGTQFSHLDKTSVGGAPKSSENVLEANF